MLSEAAVSLIRDVFERPDAYRHAHRISRRVVKWGLSAEPVALDHHAVVVSESDLLNELEQSPSDRSGGEGDFTIFASRPLPHGPVEHCFGTRTASAAAVQLRSAKDSANCWIESLEDGWLFLIPNALGSGWLLSVGRPAHESIEQSTLIAGRIASMSQPESAFSSSPRIISPLSGHQWLACGTAAITFDPICGDGTAHAVREAILASAVVRAIASGGDPEGVQAHYEARLLAGFQRHLASSMDFYRSGNSGVWWENELSLLAQGLKWCGERASGFAGYRYRLSGFELSSIDNGLA
jgi:2-polyprenyl-6-methoxyphenol hydroxylase-like FAD-dependent oxidoreductase